MVGSNHGFELTASEIGRIEHAAGRLLLAAAACRRLSGAVRVADSSPVVALFAVLDELEQEAAGAVHADRSPHALDTPLPPWEDMVEPPDVDPLSAWHGFALAIYECLDMIDHPEDPGIPGSVLGSVVEALETIAERPLLDPSANPEHAARTRHVGTLYGNPLLTAELGAQRFTLALLAGGGDWSAAVIAQANAHARWLARIAG